MEKWLPDLQKWDGLLSQSMFLIDILRQLGWLIVKLLKYVCDACENLLNATYKLLDFTSYAGVTEFFDNFYTKVFVGILCAGALLVLGYTLIVNREEKKPKVIQNIIILVFVLAALPTLLQMLNSALIASNNAVNSIGTENANYSDVVIANNIIDLKYIDSKGIDNYTIDGDIITNGKAKNNFTGKNTKNVSNIDPAETLDPDDTESEMFKYELINDENGNVEVEKIKGGFWFWENDPYYHRYNINFLAIYIGLAATTIALLFSAFKTSRIIWELVVHRFLAILFAATDLTNGQRAKQVLKSIASTYVVLFLMTVILKFFMLAQGFISDRISSPLSQALIILALALAVIDGPNIIERLLGIDAGISSGMRAMATVFYGSRAVAGTARGAVKGAVGAIKTSGKGVVGAVKGGAATAGFFNGIHNNNKENTNISETNNIGKSNNVNSSTSGGQVNNQDKTRSTGSAENNINQQNTDIAPNGQAAQDINSQNEAASSGAFANLHNSDVLNNPAGQEMNNPINSKNQAANPLNTTSERKQSSIGIRPNNIITRAIDSVKSSYEGGKYVGNKTADFAHKIAQPIKKKDKK